VDAITDRRLRDAALAVLAVGTLLQLYFWSRHWVAGDQFTLLALGYDWAQGAPLAPFAKPMSGGGRIPGSLLQLMLGLSLKVWPDFRSPALLMSLTHVAAVAVIGHTLRAAVGPRFTVFYLAVYWLSPWRLFHSGFLWEPGFVFLPAAVHLACAYRLRQEGRFWPSAILAATLVFTFQIHASFMVLAVATAVLLAMRKLRLNYWGAAAGALAGGLTLIPTVLAYLRDDLPRLAPTWGGDLPPLIGNAFKGLLYWFRFGSLDVGRRLRAALPLAEENLAGSAWLPLAKLTLTVLVVLALLSIVIAAVASWSYFRRRGEIPPTHGDDAEWVRGYALTFFLTVVGASAISPVTIQSWHVIVALHAACLPVAFWVEESFMCEVRWRRIVAVSFIALMPIVAFVANDASFMYRRPADARTVVEQVPEDVQPLFRSLTPGATTGSD
jgi:hypothetical protein